MAIRESKEARQRERGGGNIGEKGKRKTEEEVLKCAATISVSYEVKNDSPIDRLKSRSKLLEAATRPPLRRC